MIDANQAALVAINEALRCLDFDAIGSHPADGLVEDAVDALADARDLLLGLRGETEKPWPEFDLPTAYREAFEAWHAARAAEQRKDGRL